MRALFSAPPPPARKRVLAALPALIILCAALWALRERLPPSAGGSGIDYVRVLGGEFQMQIPGDPGHGATRRVVVGDFSLGRTEVTVAQFRSFVERTGFRTDAEREDQCFTLDVSGSWGQQRGRSWRDPGFPQSDAHPVVCVSMRDAEAFAAWAGARLPTETEWEYAAGNGARHTPFSWGEGPPTGGRGGNVADESAKRRFPTWRIFDGYDDGHVFTAAVGGFAPNDFGLFDMTGNAGEWCRVNPGGGSGTTADNRVTRGASWSDPPFVARVNVRQIAGSAISRNGATGFRVAR